MPRTPSRTSMMVLAALVALASAAAPPALAQRKDDKDKKTEGLTVAQRQETAPLARLVDDVMKGAVSPGAYLVTVPKDPTAKDAPAPQATQADATLVWRNDFLKAQQGAVFVPFSVTAEGGKPAAITGYLRVAPKGATGPAVAEKPASGEKPSSSGEKPTAGEKPPYAFEDAYFAELRTPAVGLPPRITRAFAVAPGAYDVYFAIRERPTGNTAADAPVKVSVIKQELVVPNYHTDELQTSSILVADKIDQLTAPLAPDAVKERPYVLGDSEITPAADLKFKKTEELQLVFQIYGAKTGPDKKPDVSVDYVFYQKDATGEKPFNRTPTQTLSEKTLPQNFDAEKGHQLMTGQGVPLQTFPEGDFRLEIKITDNKSQKSVTRDVLFTVLAAS